MIADLDETLRELLMADMPVKNGEIDIRFDQPKREWSARLIKPTINLFLYDVRENVTLRRHQWEKMGGGNGRNGGVEAIARLKRSPFRVDCHYMLTTWATDPADEHRLLTRVMLALFRYPTLPAERMAGQMANQPFEVQAALARHDRLTNPAEVWGALDNEMRPSVSYIVTIALDPWTPVEGPLVRSRTLRTGQAAGLPQVRELADEGFSASLTTIGGTVRSGDAPQAGVTVAVKNTGLLDTTDENGRYILGSLPPGDHVLLAWRGDGKPKQKKITVPAAGDGYDLKI